MKTNTIIRGDSILEMQTLEPNSVDAIITDPPYGLQFMGKEWDTFKEYKEKPQTDRTKRIRYYKPDGTPVYWFQPTYLPKNFKFMGKNQDNKNELMENFFYIWAIECLRVLKPGGFLLSFGGTRTYHRLVCGIEDAGFEIRDTIMWLYGSGFPKSLNIGKALDKLNGKRQEEFIALGKYLREARGEIPQNQISKFFPSKTGGLTGCVSNWELGLNVPTKEQWIILKKELNLDDKFDYLIDRIEAERKVIGRYTDPETKKEYYNTPYRTKFFTHKMEDKDFIITAPATPEAKEWEGWGTALKPAVEPIVVARKPLSEKNVALNVLKWGTGGMNIDESRIGTGADKIKGGCKAGNPYHLTANPTEIKLNQEQGRFPANIILDEEAGRMLDEQSGESSSNVRVDNQTKVGEKIGMFEGGWKERGNTRGHLDKGGASRFFYCAKASKSERNFGCEELPLKEVSINQPHNSKDLEERYAMKFKNNHPTVKPIKLMEYLIKLVSRKGSVVLDPFMGSGTTAIACLKTNRKFIGIEKEDEYIKIANARIKPYLEQTKL